MALQTTFHLSINPEQISIWILYPETTTACVNQLWLNLNCIQIKETLICLFLVLGPMPGCASERAILYTTSIHLLHVYTSESLNRAKQWFARGTA